MFRGTGAPALPVQLIGPPLGAGMLSVAAVVPCCGERSGWPGDGEGGCEVYYRILVKREQ